MKRLFDRENARRADELAIIEYGFHEDILMEHAALSVAHAIENEVSKDTWILVVCGTGNNGADGFATARLLCKAGFNVCCVPVGDREKMNEMVKAQENMAAVSGVVILKEDAITNPVFGVYVDALFGTGLNREVKGIYRDAIEKMNASGNRIYSIDIPSGLDSTLGFPLGICIKADVTITFGAQKLGMVMYPGREYAGSVIVSDIGYPSVIYSKLDNNLFYMDGDDIKELLPPRDVSGHKGTFGKVVIIGGCDKMSGAPCFSALGAYRAGCGLVKVISSASNKNIILGNVGEALFDAYDDEQDSSGFNKKVLDDAMEFADAIVLGVGLGTDKIAKDITNYVLSNAKVPIVLDGDGINLADRELLNNKNIILTPHMGESVRLLGLSMDEIRNDRISVFKKFAGENGCIYVGKDACTVVTDGTGVYVNTSGNDGMATGGSGDCLSGIIASNIAQGLDIFLASTISVYIHGLSADVMAQKYGKYTLIARDIIEGLRHISL